MKNPFPKHLDPSVKMEVKETPEDVLRRLRTWIYDCTFIDYRMSVTLDRRGSFYLQAQYEEADIVTGEEETQHTRRWLLSPEMTKSEVVQTAFKMCMTSMEHRTREGFKYRGKRVFGPHFDVDALHSICGQLDYRKS